LNEIKTNYEGYEMLRFVVRYGKIVSVIFALAVVGTSLFVAWDSQSVFLAPAGVAVGIVVYGLLRLLTEVVMVISDMLLPK